MSGEDDTVTLDEYTSVFGDDEDSVWWFHKTNTDNSGVLTISEITYSLNECWSY